MANTPSRRVRQAQAKTLSSLRKLQQKLEAALTLPLHPDTAAALLPALHGAIQAIEDYTKLLGDLI
jgi:hypothetical protein